MPFKNNLSSHYYFEVDRKMFVIRSIIIALILCNCYVSSDDSIKETSKSNVSDEILKI